MSVYGCHNRSHLRQTLEVQDGWNKNGTRNMVTAIVRSNPDCQYDQSHTDVKCAGCRWVGGEKND